MKKYIELLFLQQLKNVGNCTINKRYIEHLQDIDGLDACSEIVKRQGIFSDIEIEEAKKAAEKKSSKILEYGDISITTVFDKTYPKRFNDLCNKRPVIVYTKGNIEVLEKQSIAVIGTRHPSDWSKKSEFEIVDNIIKESGSLILSGLALGCDEIAHKTALKKSGTTAAVLPSGLNEITPRSNIGLAEEILTAGGCLVSAYEPDMMPLKSNFIERDALVAALSDALVVIESGEKGGTMHTVHSAKSMNRPIGAYYADESKGYYSGNRMIIANGGYKIRNAKDLKSFLYDIRENRDRIRHDMTVQLNMNFFEDK